MRNAYNRRFNTPGVVTVHSVWAQILGAICKLAQLKKKFNPTYEISYEEPEEFPDVEVTVVEPVRKRTGSIRSPSVTHLYFFYRHSEWRVVTKKGGLNYGRFATRSFTKFGSPVSHPVLHVRRLLSKAGGHMIVFCILSPTMEFRSDVSQHSNSFTDGFYPDLIRVRHMHPQRNLRSVAASRIQRAYRRATLHTPPNQSLLHRVTTLRRAGFNREANRERHRAGLAVR